MKKLLGSKQERIEHLAAIMLPTLLARRFDLGMGGEPDQAFVEKALELAERIVAGKVKKGPRALVLEALEGL